MDDKLSSAIEYIHKWYVAYIGLVKYMGAISTGVLVITTTVLFKEIFSDGLIKESASSLIYIKYSFVAFGVATIIVLLNLLATYSWYITGVSIALRKAEVDLPETLGDEFSYRNKLGSMGLWGKISFISGVVIGVSVLIGIILYIKGASEIITIALEKASNGN